MDIRPTGTLVAHRCGGSLYRDIYNTAGALIAKFGSAGHIWIIDTDGGIIATGGPIIDTVLPGGTAMADPGVRFRIDFAEHSSLGPGKIRLLEAIRDSGSLSQGARTLGMSYRRAWLLVESLRQSFRDPVTVASTGGKDGGGMQVTEFGEALIRSYRQFERDIATLAARSFHAIIPTVRHSRSAGKTSIRARLE